MAKFLSFDKKQFNSEGVIPLRRGDDWKLIGSVIEKYARYQEPFDLSNVVGATGWVPSATGGNMPVAFEISDAKCGTFEMSLAASGTINTALDETTSVYTVLDDSILGTITVETEFQPVQIRDRGFIQT